MTSNRLVLETPRGWKSIRRLLRFPESAPISREMFAIRPATCRPSNGRREKRNWHLRSPAGMPFRSVRATNSTDSAGPTHGERPNLRQVRFELRHHDSQHCGLRRAFPRSPLSNTSRFSRAPNFTACRNRKVVMSQLINPVVNLEFHQITNRGKKLPPGADDFTAFLKIYISRWAGRAGVL